MSHLIKSFSEIFESPFVNKEEMIKLIASCIPEFKHIETGKSLDGKMQ